MYVVKPRFKDFLEYKLLYLRWGFWKTEPIMADKLS
jgi:hypothetical protein